MYISKFALTEFAEKKTLDEPVGYIIQNKRNLNFDDIIERFSSKGKPKSTKPPVHFNILNIKINKGVFYYVEKSMAINYFIKNVDIESSGKWWNADTLDLKFSFLSGPATGDIKGNGMLNIANLDYRLALVAKKYDLQIIQQYLKDLANYGHFAANLDADIKATGNILDRENINASGLASLNDFHFGKALGDDFASFTKLVLDVTQLNPKKFIYNFDSVTVTQPYFKYERYDNLDNLQMMFGKKGANLQAGMDKQQTQFNLILEIADYVRVLAKNFFKSNYKLGRAAIYNGDLHYNDYSLNEKFSLALNPLNVHADSINKNKQRVQLYLTSGIKPYGNMNLNLSINPKDEGDFNLVYHINKLPLTMFNPYVIKYTSFPLDRGTLELNGTWNVINGKIQSDNHLLLLDPHKTKRIKRRGNKWLPLPLVFAFIRERGNVIDYEIPIKGDLKNPKFKIKDVLLDLLENVFVKPVSIPYMTKVDNVENELEKTLNLTWKVRQIEHLLFFDRLRLCYSYFLQLNN